VSASYRFSFAKILLAANFFFWLLFAINFALSSEPFELHEKQWEEHSPAYVFWGHAFYVKQYANFVMRTTKLAQKPSFYAGVPFNLIFSRRGIAVDKLYRGISVGGYYLIVVSLISFLQWYVVGLILDRFRLTVQKRNTTTSD